MTRELTNIVGELIEGENCRIDPFVTITGKVTIGNNVHIGVGACIFGGEGVTIGNDSGLSPGAKIFTGTFDAESMYRGNPQVDGAAPAYGPVKIGDRCLVGANSVVLPGTVIENDTCIGALSLVKGSIPSGFIYAGIQAKALGKKPRS